MSKLKIATQQLVKETQLQAGRSENDTIRLWENYRDQATMWRSLALLQIPATSIAILFAIFMWGTRVITLQVPAKPLPGIYAAYDIPDTEFINQATDYVNLIATYQPAVARRQFVSARAMLKEPLLTKFNEEMMTTELQAIENTNRTQVFYIDPTLTTVDRTGNEVTITMVGERSKMIAGQELPTKTSRYRVTMTTIPRNTTNPYGIVITNVDFKADVKSERGEKQSTEGAQ